MHALYTCIVDYAGGTYISQVNAENEDMALLSWCELFPSGEGIPDDVKPLAEAFRLEHTDKDPRFRSELISISGTTSVWIAGVLYNDVVARMHLIKTAD